MAEMVLEAAERYSFEGGFPTAETVARAYDDMDLTRAVEAYRWFFPTVSGLAIWKGTLAAGVVPNEVFGILDTRPRHVGLTLNSDTPYAPVLLDLHDGPRLVELPAGPLMCAMLDLGQGWLADMGLPGPDAGQGGTFLAVPPGWDGEVPDGVHVVQSTTHRVVVGIRAIPVGGDLAAAHALITGIQVRPLDPGADWTPPTWPDLTPAPQDTTPDRWETTLEFWRQLHEVVATEPIGDQAFYGLLADLGITADQPFDPDARMTAILERAAVVANGQMRVEAFADRRGDRVVWPGTRWEWPALRPENGLFLDAGHVDVHAREKWFFQAIAASPAMFRRDPQAGSLYWLGTRAGDGQYLDGSRHYTLTVPQPVPARLFWSITVYDAQTRSQIEAPQDRAALRSLFELSGVDGTGELELHFGPEAPVGQEDHWVQTVPGRGWFVYFRVYGPEAPAFDGNWRLPDFELVTSG